MTDQEFWLHRPSVLLTNLTFLPDKGMTPNQLLNTITRLIIIIALLLFILSFGEWWLFLILGILLVILIWHFNFSKKPNYPLAPPDPNVRIEHFRCRPRSKFKLRPRYGNTRVTN